MWAVSLNEKQAQLKRLLASETLSRSEKLQQLLGYLVERAFKPDGPALRGVDIAVDVFGRRREDYDASSDSIVRVQVGRLRNALDAYYEGEGASDPVVIAIPKGGYAVEFSPGVQAAIPAEAQPVLESVKLTVQDAATGLEQKSERQNNHHTNHIRDRSWREIAVTMGVGMLLVLFAVVLVQRGNNRGESGDVSGGEFETAGAASQSRGLHLEVGSFLDVGPSGDTEGQADGFTQNLIAALSRSAELVVTSGSLDQEPSTRSMTQSPDYVIEGVRRQYESALRVTLRLMEGETEETIWSKTFDRSDASDLVREDAIIAAIVMDLRPQIYLAARRRIAATPNEQLTPWELYLKSTFLPGDQTDSLQKEKARLDMAILAAQLDPDLSEAHSVIAEKMAFLFIVDPSTNTAGNRTIAAKHAQQAMSRARDNSDVMFNVALYHVLIGETETALPQMQRVLELDPSHVMARYQTIILPFHCAPPSQQGLAELLDLYEDVPVDHPSRWIMLYDVARALVNAGRLEDALELHAQIETLGASPLVVVQHAVLLQAAGRTGEAVALMQDYKRDWPTLDMRYLAEEIWPDNCQGRPSQAQLVKLYSDMADALDAAAP